MCFFERRICEFDFVGNEVSLVFNLAGLQFILSVEPFLYKYFKQTLMCDMPVGRAVTLRLWSGAYEVQSSSRSYQAQFCPRLAISSKGAVLPGGAMRRKWAPQLAAHSGVKQKVL